MAELRKLPMGTIMIFYKTLLVGAMFLAAASGTVLAEEKSPNDLSKKVLKASEKCRIGSLEIGKIANGKNLAFILNVSRYLLRIAGPEMEPGGSTVFSGGCLSRTLPKGNYLYSLTAYQQETYSWVPFLPPSVDWFSTGLAFIEVSAPQTASTILEVIIRDEDILIYSAGEYMQENFLKLLNIYGSYVFIMGVLIFYWVLATLIISEVIARRIVRS